MARFLLENITREKPNVAQYYLGYINDFDQPDLASNPCLNAIVDRLIGVLYNFYYYQSSYIPITNKNRVPRHSCPQIPN